MHQRVLFYTEKVCAILVRVNKLWNNLLNKISGETHNYEYFSKILLYLIVIYTEHGMLAEKVHFLFFKQAGSNLFSIFAFLNFSDFLNSNKIIITYHILPQ